MHKLFVAWARVVMLEASNNGSWCSCRGSNGLVQNVQKANKTEPQNKSTKRQTMKTTDKIFKFRLWIRLIPPSYKANVTREIVCSNDNRNYRQQNTFICEKTLESLYGILKLKQRYKQNQNTLRTRNAEHDKARRNETILINIDGELCFVCLVHFAWIGGICGRVACLRGAFFICMPRVCRRCFYSDIQLMNYDIYSLEPVERTSHAFHLQLASIPPQIMRNKAFLTAKKMK